MSACVLVRVCVTLWTVACQSLLSMAFSSQENWSGLPYCFPGDLPNPGMESVSLTSLALAGRFFTTSITWEVPSGPSLLQTLSSDIVLVAYCCFNKELHIQWLRKIHSCYLTGLQARARLGQAFSTLSFRRLKSRRLRIHVQVESSCGHNPVPCCCRTEMPVLWMLSLPLPALRSLSRVFTCDPSIWQPSSVHQPFSAGNLCEIPFY